MVEKFPHPVPLVWNISLCQSPVGYLLSSLVSIPMAMNTSPNTCEERVLLRMFMVCKSCLPRVTSCYVVYWSRCCSVSPVSLQDPVGRDCVFLFSALQISITVLHRKVFKDPSSWTGLCLIAYICFFSLGFHSINFAHQMNTQHSFGENLLNITLFQVGSQNLRIWRPTLLSLLTRWKIHLVIPGKGDVCIQCSGLEGFTDAEEGKGTPDLWFSKCDLQISSLTITGDLVRNAEFQISPQTYWIRLCQATMCFTNTLQLDKHSWRQWNSACMKSQERMITHGFSVGTISCSMQLERKVQIWVWGKGRLDRFRFWGGTPSVTPAVWISSWKL